MTATTTPSPRAKGVTLRALLIACVLLPLNAYWIIQMEVVRYQGHPTTISLFFNAIFILFVLVLGNSLLHRILPRHSLHRNELLVIYMMVTVASALCGHDLIEVVSPQIVMPFWMASPENKWEALFFQYLPRHLTISDPRVYTTAFTGESSLYSPDRLAAWSVPVLSWGTFLIVLSTMMLAINGILRQRWMDREKLNYPITHLPLELSRPQMPLFRDKIMWIGFGLAAAIDILNGCHELWPQVPLIKVRVVHYDALMGNLFRSYPWSALAGTRISFYPFAIGLGMLLPLELAFSCWFFYLFWKGERLLATVIGLSRIPGFPYVDEQATAAYLGLAAFSLWMSRGYLKEIFQRAIGRFKAVDSGEPIPYATALWIIGGGAVFLILFAAAAGMWAWLSTIFFLLYFLISLAVTRIRAELGPPAHDLHHGGPDLILTNILGTNSAVLNPRQLTAMSVFYWFNRAYRSHPMPIQLESFKIAQVSGISQRGVAIALTIATVVGVFSAFWAQVHCFYAYGIDAKMSFATQTFGREPYARLADWLVHPLATQWPRVGAYLVSFGFTLLLMFLRVNYMWWPFHPVGFAISSSWSMNCLWLPILIAWATKWLLIRYGGYKVFQSAIPFALGLILGEFIIGSLWTLIGVIFGISTYAFWV